MYGHASLQIRSLCVVNSGQKKPLVNLVQHTAKGARIALSDFISHPRSLYCLGVFVFNFLHHHFCTVRFDSLFILSFCQGVAVAYTSFCNEQFGSTNVLLSEYSSQIYDVREGVQISKTTVCDLSKLLGKRM